MSPVLNFPSAVHSLALKKANYVKVNINKIQLCKVETPSEQIIHVGVLVMEQMSPCEE